MRDMIKGLGTGWVMITPRRRSVKKFDLGDAQANGQTRVAPASNARADDVFAEGPAPLLRKRRSTKAKKMREELGVHSGSCPLDSLTVSEELNGSTMACVEQCPDAAERRDGMRSA
jgi:hypothetical protein